MLEGSTQAAPLKDSGTISGNLEVCPDAVRTYTTTEVPGATIYEWTLDETNTLWSLVDGLSCIDYPQPEAMPFVTTTYSVEVVSEDECTAVDSLTIVVQERRRVYTPNAFSPNEDGVNDRFVLYGGPEVALIQTLSIYSRWGGKVFEQSGFPPNDPGSGWDGQFRGEPLKAGIYAWSAEVAFLDGVVILYEGDVMLLR